MLDEPLDPFLPAVLPCTDVRCSSGCCLPTFQDTCSVEWTGAKDAREDCAQDPDSSLCLQPCNLASKPGRLCWRLLNYGLVESWFQWLYQPVWNCFKGNNRKISERQGVPERIWTFPSIPYQTELNWTELYPPVAFPAWLESHLRCHSWPAPADPGSLWSSVPCTHVFHTINLINMSGKTLKIMSLERMSRARSQLSQHVQKVSEILSPAHMFTHNVSMSRKSPEICPCAHLKYTPNLVNTSRKSLKLSSLYTSYTQST